MPHLFGEKLRYLRQQRGMTQMELAQSLGLARQGYISNLEAQRKEPSLILLLRIIAFFGVTADYLLRHDVPIEAVNPQSDPKVAQSVSFPSLFGAKLRRLRKQHGLSQTELARRLRLAAHAHISLLERGHHEPSIDLVIAVANNFGVTTDYLLQDSIPLASDESEIRG